ncbi:MAG TPA: site-2 protease family protein [Steroidobacter sp.]
MTTFMIQIFVAVVLLLFLHVSALALAGVAFGIELREVSFGVGKALFSRGKVTVRLLPISGYAKYASTFETPEADPATTFNHKPALVRAVVPLTGCVALMLVAAMIPVGAGISEVTEGFRQVIVGAFGPTSTAQGYIQALHDRSLSHGFMVVLGVLAAKMAALNLLPLPFLNGGQALLAFVPTDPNVEPGWQQKLVQFTFLPFIALMGAWLYAICIFAIGSPPA